MSDKKKSAWNDHLISRRRMLHYGLAGIAGIAGGFWPLSALGEAHLMSSTKTGGMSENTMNTYRKCDIEKAEHIITKYIYDKYEWSKNDYKISIYAKDKFSSSIDFMIYHNDDKNSMKSGGGKSLIIKMDMESMTVVQESGFQ